MANNDNTLPINNSLLVRGIVSYNVVIAVITQTFVQFAGGGRNEGIPISGQMGLDFLPTVFENGLPPFISSGAIFQPEATLFAIGFGSAGVIFAYLTLQIAKAIQQVRSRQKNKEGIQDWRLMFGFIPAICMVGVALFPMHTDLLLHLIFAFTMFGSFWLYSLFLSNALHDYDGGKQWAGRDLAKQRRLLLTIGLVSMVISGFGFFIESFTLSAIFEWILFLSLNLILLSFSSLFDENTNGLSCVE